MSTWGPRAGTSHGGLEPPWGSCCLDFEGKEPTVTASSSCHRLLWGVLVLPRSQEAERKEPLLPWQPAPSTGKLLPVLVEAPPGPALVLLLGLDGVSGTSHCYLLGEEAWASGSAKWDLGWHYDEPFCCFKPETPNRPCKSFYITLGQTLVLSCQNRSSCGWEGCVC